MDFLSLAKSRYSVRKYDGRAVEQEKIDSLIDAALLSPSASNRQPIRLYVLRSEEALAKVRELTTNTYRAPLVFLVAYDRGEQAVNPCEPGFASGQEDASIAATHMMLQAHALGLGSCWVNYFPPMRAARMFDLPESETPVLLLAVGYPAADAAPSPLHCKRRARTEIVRER